MCFSRLIDFVDRDTVVLYPFTMLRIGKEGSLKFNGHMQFIPILQRKIEHREGSNIVKLSQLANARAGKRV